MTDRQEDCAVFSYETGASEAAQGERRSAGWWVGACAAWLFVALVVFSLGLFPLRTSTDEWWHLKTGQWIVAHGYQVPQKDIFTYTASSYAWDNHEWLSEALMYEVWHWGEGADLGGWRTLIVLKALLLVGTYLLLGRFVCQRAGGGTRGVAIAVFVTVLAAAVGRRMFWPRPPVVSNLFFVFYLYVLWLHRSGRLKTPWLFVLPLLMPLWANLHGGFLLGCVAVAAHFGGAVVEWGVGRWGARRTVEELKPVALRVWVYLVLGVACGLASLLTPFGYRLYLLSMRVMQSRALVEVLGELLPPDLRFTWAFVFLTALLAKGLGVLVGRSLAGRWSGWGAGVLAVGLGVSLWGAVAHVRGVMANGGDGGDVFQCVPVYAFFLGFLGLCSGYLASRVAFPRERDWEWPPVADLLIAGFFWWQAVGHLRHLVLFGLAAAPLAGWLLRYLWEKGRFPGLMRQALWGMSLVMGVWLVFFPGEAIATWAGLREGAGPGTARRFGLSQFDRNRQMLDGLEMEPGAYPVAAMDFVLEARLPGRMFNADNCAGYLIWRLSPEHYQVFTDSRFDIFGQDFLRDEQSVCNGWTERFLAGLRGQFGEEKWDGIRPWRQVVEAWDINWLFLEKSELVNCELVRPDSGWALVYLGRSDPYAMWPDPFTIWMKRTPENQPWIARYEKRQKVEELRDYLVKQGVGGHALE